MARIDCAALCPRLQAASLDGEEELVGVLHPGELRYDFKVTRFNDILPYPGEVIHPHLKILDEMILIYLKRNRVLFDELSKGRDLGGPPDLEPKCLVLLH